MNRTLLNTMIGDPNTLAREYAERVVASSLLQFKRRVAEDWLAGHAAGVAESAARIRALEAEVKVWRGRAALKETP